MEGRRRVRIFHALRYRDFRLLFAGQTISLIGDAAFLTALGWKTYTLVGSGRFGIVLFCQATALLTTLLVGGALADRISRRKMMIASDLARFVAVGALAAVDASGHLNFTWIIVLSVLMGLGDGLFYPAFGGMVPLVVEPGAIPSANSLIGVARWSSLLVGPAFAALLYGAAGSAVVFAIDAASFLVSAGLLWFTRPRAVEAAAGEGTVREIWSGVRYVAGVPWLWVTIALFSVVLMLQFAPQQVLLPKLIHQHFGQGVGAYGLLTSLLGVGTVAGTLAFGQLQPRHRRGVISYVVWLDQQPGDRRCRVIAVVRAGLRLRGAAWVLHRLRRRDLGDDADGARPHEPAVARRQPRLLRLLRPDAGRAGRRSGDLGPRRAGDDHRRGRAHLRRHVRRRADATVAESRGLTR